MRINCSFYVKYSTALHGFAGILAKKLAPNVENPDELMNWFFFTFGDGITRLIKSPYSQHLKVSYLILLTFYTLD